MRTTLGPKTPHAIYPQLIEMFNRYQCRHCHSWVTYDEFIGSWFHLRTLHEELKEWVWRGNAWHHETNCCSDETNC